MAFVTGIVSILSITAHVAASRDGRATTSGAGQACDRGAHTPDGGSLCARRLRVPPRRHHEHRPAGPSEPQAPNPDVRCDYPRTLARQLPDTLLPSAFSIRLARLAKQARFAALRSSSVCSLLRRSRGSPPSGGPPSTRHLSATPPSSCESANQQQPVGASCIQPLCRTSSYMRTSLKCHLHQPITLAKNVGKSAFSHV